MDCPDKSSIMVHERKLQVRDRVKYLVVTLDTKLTCKFRLEKITCKATEFYGRDGGLWVGHVDWNQRWYTGCTLKL